MSLLSRNAAPYLASLAAAGLLAGVTPDVASAADTYFVPGASARFEHDSNRNLTPDGQPSENVTGYRATAEALIGSRTPRSDTQLRPQISISRYPDTKEFNQTEAQVDLRSNYRSQRSTLGLIARYSRTSEYNAEFADIAFDDFDPTAPVVGGDGRVIASERRTRIDVRPSFLYQLTPRTGIGLDVLAQDVSYDADGPTSQVDHRNYDFDLHVTRLLTPKTTMLLGVFVSRYETDDDLNQTDGYGLSAALRQRWSETFTGDVAFRIEDSDIEYRGLVPQKENRTTWSLQGGLAWRGQVTRVRMSLGRALTPSGDGSRAIRDELRAQFDRDLSQRLVWHGIARAMTQKSLGDLVPDNKRDSVRVESSLDWRASRTWTVSLGAAYTWQDREADPSSADNTSFFVTVGYRGLGPAGR